MICGYKLVNSFYNNITIDTIGSQRIGSCNLDYVNCLAIQVYQYAGS